MTTAIQQRPEDDMVDAAYFRDKAQHCRNMAKIAINPDVRVQLLRFADEFGQKADEIEPLMEAAPAAR